MPKLYHIVFSEDYQEVSILDHKLQVIDGGEARLCTRNLVQGDTSQDESRFISLLSLGS